MSENILLTYLYDLGKDPHDLGKDYGVFTKIHELCVASFADNLAAIDEHIILRGRFHHQPNTPWTITQNKMNEDVYWKTYELFRGRPCNILLVDSDMLCVKPTEIFGKFDKYSLFNVAGCDAPLELESLCLNSAVRYFPATMDKSVWEVGTEYAKQWEEYAGVWAYDQYVYNQVFYAQDVGNAEDFLRPWLNFNAPVRGRIDNRGTSIRDAHIIHFHSSRGARETLEIMEKARTSGLQSLYQRFE